MTTSCSALVAPRAFGFARGRRRIRMGSASRSDFCDVATVFMLLRDHLSRSKQRMAGPRALSQTSSDKSTRMAAGLLRTAIQILVKAAISKYSIHIFHEDFDRRIAWYPTLGGFEAFAEHLSSGLRIADTMCGCTAESHSQPANLRSACAARDPTLVRIPNT